MKHHRLLNCSALKRVNWRHHRRAGRESMAEGLARLITQLQREMSLSEQQHLEVSQLLGRAVLLERRMHMIREELIAAGVSSIGTSRSDNSTCAMEVEDRIEQLASQSKQLFDLFVSIGRILTEDQRKHMGSLLAERELRHRRPHHD